MKYGTPTAFRMALTKRLQDRAAASGRSAQRLLQLVAFERFLARIFRALGERATLKGGVAMELRVQRARTTRDVDLRIMGEHPERLLETLRGGRPRNRRAPPASGRRRSRIPWALLVWRVWNTDVERCPRCHQEMTRTAVLVEDAE